MNLWPEDYLRPGLAHDHCADVLSGSYDVAYDPPAPPVILDLGANIGAFARWAALRWIGSIIHCYEPHPDNYALLVRTAAEIKSATVILHEQAVFTKNGRTLLGQGGLNCGEYTLQSTSRDDSPVAIVEVIAALSLPKADILKVDTEGCELGIFRQLAEYGLLRGFSAIMFEFHAAPTAEEISAILVNHGFHRVGHKLNSEHRGEMKFLL